MKKKIVFLSIIISIIVILIASIYLYSTYATDPIESNDSYTITLSGDTSVSVPANSSKKVIYQIKNTNDGTVNYAVGYSSENQNTKVKIYYDSTDPASGSITENDYKYIKLRLINNSNTNALINLSTILGYENGGELILPSGVTKVTEVVPVASNYITNLYTNATKSDATVNNITYNLAPSVNLMNDRHASMSTGADAGDIRYYGADPSNYVWLGDIYKEAYTFESNGTEITRNAGDKKLWRVVGIFGGKVKLVQNDPIGYYSWDTSDSSVNDGYGINQWGESGNYDGADLMRLLNPGYEGELVNNSLYWTEGNGNVYTWDYDNSISTTVNKNFANIGLSNAEKNMIDTVTWYTGAYDNVSYVDAHYNAERGSMGKICSGGDSCNDTVVRTSTWTGKVGLIYPSDYGYASNLSQCNQTLVKYYETGCFDTNWLKTDTIDWTMSPRAGSGDAIYVFGVYDDGRVDYDANYIDNAVRPSVFLKSDVVIIDGNGSENTPYILNLG